MKSPNGKTVASTLAALIFLTACAGAQRSQGNSTLTDDPCDPTKTALAGAAVGLAIGALTGNKKNIATGGLIGSAIGALACIAVNSQSRQTKSAAIVEQEFAKRQGALPTQPQVVSYQTRMDPGGVVKSNTDVRMRTNVEVVRGTAVPVREVKEEIVFYDTQNKEFKRGSKILSEGSGGSYENDWQFKLPPGVTQGNYRVQTLMYLNGQMVAQRDTALQLVMLPDGLHIAQAF